MKLTIISAFLTYKKYFIITRIVNNIEIKDLSKQDNIMRGWWRWHKYLRYMFNFKQI